MNRQSGFTLIELVMVIVIIGILAAVAVPKYMDLTADANTAATQGVAGALSSGSAINYATCKAGGSGCVSVGNCTSVSSTLSSMPSGYTITSTAVLPDASVSCTLTGPGSATANFTAIGTT